jgi:MFS family permease
MPFIITVHAYAQKITPPELVGKVMSLFSSVPWVAAGIGYFLAGFAFERFSHAPHLISFSATAIVVITMLLTCKAFKENI